ncbi:hypothetical protein BgiBS90_005126 [Biomphalaria glabrata]|nr:hypothetical protein BgiBS90_005126 [Biomphalaria glabrata]
MLCFECQRCHCDRPACEIYSRCCPDISFPTYHLDIVNGAKHPIMADGKANSLMGISGKANSLMDISGKPNSLTLLNALGLTRIEEKELTVGCTASPSFSYVLLTIKATKP